LNDDIEALLAGHSWPSREGLGHDYVALLRMAALLNDVMAGTGADDDAGRLRVVGRPRCSAAPRA